MYNGKTILLLTVQEMGNQVPSIHLAESDDGINFKIHKEAFIKRSENFHDLDLWPVDPRLSYIPEDDMCHSFIEVEYKKFYRNGNLRYC